jgi:anti-sigma factor RsiW
VDETHERYEALAVGHVLGGLPPAAAADFRHHLTGCRDCRLRVAELRSIADDLAAAEREERAEARVRTEVAQQTTEGHDGDVDPRGPALTSRHLGLGALVIILVATGLAFWNLHLRTQVATLTGVAEQQDDTLTGLADGIPVVTEFPGDGRGVVVADGQQVAFSLPGLEPLAGGER